VEANCSAGECYIVEGNGLCVLSTPKTVIVVLSWIFVDGVVAIGDGNNIFGAVEV